MLDTRLQIWASVMVAWAAALGAIFVHPALWAAFALVLCVSVYKSMQTRDADR